ncbi:phosphoglycerate mutase [Ophiostoma piceae UAMH 11346]|uniref:Phosphoglycerate mutase n=1 Tax=Ophiostoma piceae (strain UAMH 11346) TaxID=1262450 RepID=S3C9G1_OPHP1|nr:phosphoglycerate mutase [Ophiostoma piceae UAMH 11346]
MADLEARTPRVFLARHGETEWAKNGRYTGITDIDLTDNGVNQVSSAAKMLVGEAKLLDPSRLVHVFVSPRKRAVRTYQLLGVGDSPSPEVTEDIAEWDYGDYEGLKVGEIRELRHSKGLDKERPWNVWADGCEGGESMQEVTERLDKLIAKIKNIQEPYFDNDRAGDVLLVAHGLILRCFVKRWLGFPVDFPLEMIFSPGGISVMSYKNGNIKEPGFYIGLSLP